MGAYRTHTVNSHARTLLFFASLSKAYSSSQTSLYHTKSVKYTSKDGSGCIYRILQVHRHHLRVVKISVCELLYAIAHHLTGIKPSLTNKMLGH